LLPADEQAPWVVGIHELELICQLVERPAQLVHYVLRRFRSNRHRLWAMDEMDFFMRYLQDGLFWPDDVIGEAGMDLGNHTDPLDAWWYGEHGHTKPAPQPRQRIDNATKQLLDDIEATGGPNRLEAQLMMLEMDEKGRRRIAGGLKQTRRKTERDRQAHDMTLVFEDDFAVTIKAVPFADRYQLGPDLAKYGSYRTEASSLRRWVGFGVVAGSPHRLDSLVIILDPSRLDEERPDAIAAGDGRT
jgi:hypothetical protein